MIVTDILIKKVNDLETLAEEVENLGEDLIVQAPLYEGNGNYWFEPLPEHIRTIQRQAVRKYQRWYSSTLELVNEYLPGKIKEFKNAYEYDDDEGVINYLQLRTVWRTYDKSKIVEYFLRNFELQISILLSVPDVAEIKELSLRKLISADVARTEIEQAEILLSNGFERASGSIAGVALELHLKTLCDIKGVAYKAKDTIDPLVTALYSAGALDKTELKHIQYLASIRNKCSHPEPVTKKEVEELIGGVRKLV